MISGPIERPRRYLAIKDINSNRPYLGIYVSKLIENDTDRKLRVRVFDRYHFRQIWMHISRDMGDSKYGLKSLDLVEIGRSVKKSSKMYIKRWKYGKF